MLAKNCLQIFIACAVAFLLQSCDSNSDSYFPLDKGLTWRYQVSSVTSHYKNQDILVIQNMGVEVIDQKNLYVRRTSLGTNYYFVKENQDVLRVAKRAAVELRPKFDEEKRYVIKGPFEPGTSWTHQGQPYLLDRPFPTDYELRNTIRFPMTYSIVSVGEKLSTKSGLFKDCIHIRGTSVVNIGRTVSIIQDEVKFTTDEWYAPRVGLVRLIRSEDVDSSHAYGGSIEINLLEFGR